MRTSSLMRDVATGGGGRPLDPARDEAIMQAALGGLAELGYDRLSMDEIASRAHAGKGALYRRWPSKAALVVAAVSAWREEQAPMIDSRYRFTVGRPRGADYGRSRF